MAGRWQSSKVEAWSVWLWNLVHGARPALIASRGKSGFSVAVSSVQMPWRSLGRCREGPSLLSAEQLWAGYGKAAFLSMGSRWQCGRLFLNLDREAGVQKGPQSLLWGMWSSAATLEKQFGRTYQHKIHTPLILYFCFLELPHRDAPMCRQIHRYSLPSYLWKTVFPGKLNWFLVPKSLGTTVLEFLFLLLLLLLLLFTIFMHYSSSGFRNINILKEDWASGDT